MRTKRKKQLSGGRQIYRKTLTEWLCLLLAVMLVSQILIQINRRKIEWVDGNYTNVSLSYSGELINVVDSDTGLAGAVDRNGQIVIPIDNSTFDPWTGDVIKGLRQEGNLFWVIKDNRVGIVNEKNEEVIPPNYGYLKKGHENQFVAGIGEISNAVSAGGVYVHKAYGVIDENEKVIIPFEYDAMEVLDEGGYRGVMEENTETIIRTFYESGEIKEEEIELKEETQEAQEQEELPDEPVEATVVEEESPSGEAAPREDSGIEEYNGVAADFSVLNFYEEGEQSKIHLEGTKCTLEDTNGNVMAEFEGERLKETMPEYAYGSRLIIDNQEKFYRVYSGLTGALICDVSKESECILTDQLLVYEKDDVYIVKNFNNVELFRAEKGKNDQFLNSPDEKARFVFRNSYFVYQADEGRTLVTNVGVVIAQGLDSVSFNDENSTKENDESKIYICERDGKFGAFNAGGDKILDFQYENIEFFNGDRDVLRITQKKGQVGIVDYTGKVIIPLEYESVGYGNMISEASDTSVIEYLLLSAGQDQYYGKIGNRIYYLDAEGNKNDEVRYVRIEDRGRDINDFLSFGEAIESPEEYRITGNVLIMDNCFVSDLTFGRSEIYQKVEQDKVQFLLVDSMNGKIGSYTHYVGRFSMMGYQHIFWYIWMVSSRLCALVFVLWMICSVRYEDISDAWYFYRKKLKRGRKHVR